MVADEQVNQVAKVHGSGHIVVQAGGDATVNIGERPYLQLVDVLAKVKAHQERINSELALLNPYACATKLVGRECDLDDLHQWLALPKRISVRTLIGRAGSGKTRLALELIQGLAKQNKDNPATSRCDAGFLALTEMRRFLDRQNLAAWGWQQPTLIVLDYAAAATPMLRDWLGQLADNFSDTPDQAEPPLRILLLERHATREEGWLQQVLSHGQTDALVPELFDPPEPIALNPLDTIDSRRAVFADMLAQCPRQEGVVVPSVPAPGEDADFDRRLAESQWAEPLYLLMSAAVAARSGVTTALALSRTELGFEVAGHELKRIAHCAPAGNEAARRVLHLLAACATLGGDLSGTDARTLAQCITETLGLDYPDGYGQAVRDLIRALPADDHGIAAVLPDMVGEAFVWRAFEDLSPTDRDKLLLRTSELRCDNVVGSVIHLIQDYAEARPNCVDWLDTLVNALGDSDVDALMRITDALPDQTLALRERAAAICGLIAEAIRGCLEAEPGDEQSWAYLAAALNNYANRLSDLGRREEALLAAKEALDILRQLAGQRPGTFIPAFATSLSTYAVILCYSGRREEAMQPSQEALAILRRLADQRPDAFVPNLARSLNNYATVLRESDRREEALLAAKEALDIRRQLAEQRFGTFKPDLATSLNTYATILRESDHREEALQPSQEALAILRQLAEQRPDAFKSDLTKSLNNYATTLVELGRRKEALQAVQEALVTLRQLAQQRPEAFKSILAQTYGVLGCIQRALGKRADAKAAFVEGIEALKLLFEALPSAHARLMKALVRHYNEEVAYLGEGPESALLGPMLAVFETLKSNDEK